MNKEVVTRAIKETFSKPVKLIKENSTKSGTEYAKNLVIGTVAIATGTYLLVREVDRVGLSMGIAAIVVGSALIIKSTDNMVNSIRSDRRKRNTPAEINKPK